MTTEMWSGNTPRILWIEHFSNDEVLEDIERKSTYT